MIRRAVASEPNQIEIFRHGVTASPADRFQAIELLGVRPSNASGWPSPVILSPEFSE
jgi:hypothetical protein